MHCLPAEKLLKSNCLNYFGICTIIKFPNFWIPCWGQPITILLRENWPICNNVIVFITVVLECRASTNLLNFEMIGSWPTHAEKKRRKTYICRARPDQSLPPSANNRSFPSMSHSPFVEQEPIFSFFIKIISNFDNLISLNAYA